MHVVLGACAGLTTAAAAALAAELRQQFLTSGHRVCVRVLDGARGPAEGAGGLELACLYVPLLCAGALDALQDDVAAALAAARAGELAVLPVHAGRAREYTASRRAGAEARGTVAQLLREHTAYQLQHDMAADARVVRQQLEVLAWGPTSRLRLDREWDAQAALDAMEPETLAQQHATQAAWLGDIHHAEALARDCEPRQARRWRRLFAQHAADLQTLRHRIQPLLDQAPPRSHTVSTWPATVPINGELIVPRR